MVFGGRNLTDVGMKITNKEDVGSIINSKHHLKRCVIVQTVLPHFAGTAIQEGILEEELGHHDFSQYTDWQCVLMETRESPGGLTVPDHKGFQFSLQHCPQARLLPVLKSLETRH